MKTKTSMLKLAKNLTTVGLLFSIQKVGVDASKLTAEAYTESQIDADLSSLASSVQQALAESGVEADADLQALIEEHVQSEIASGVESEESQKTNLEDPELDDSSLIVSTHP
jgi:hypothetical protein